MGRQRLRLGREDSRRRRQCGDVADDGVEGGDGGLGDDLDGDGDVGQQVLEPLTRQRQPHALLLGDRHRDVPLPVLGHEQCAECGGQLREGGAGLLDDGRAAVDELTDEDGAEAVEQRHEVVEAHPLLAPAQLAQALQRVHARLPVRRRPHQQQRQAEKLLGQRRGGADGDGGGQVEGGGLGVVGGYGGGRGLVGRSAWASARPPSTPRLRAEGEGVRMGAARGVFMTGAGEAEGRGRGRRSSAITTQEEMPVVTETMSKNEQIRHG